MDRGITSWSVAILLALMTGLAGAATPPALVNYEGVLRDASDRPLSGSYDMSFHFFSSAMQGDEILIDYHVANGGGPVTVTGGLFNVTLGAGTLHDGSGPGLFTSLAQMFADYKTVYLETWIDGEVLAPRVRVVAAAYALNAASLDGRPPAHFLDTSSSTQTKSGSIVLDNAAPGGRGLDAAGAVAGGYFHNTTASGYAYLGAGDTGISAFGTSRAGHFEGVDNGTADLATAGYGLMAAGNQWGGWFGNWISGNEVYLAGNPSTSALLVKGGVRVDGSIGVNTTQPDFKLAVWGSGLFSDDQTLARHTYLNWDGWGIHAIGGTSGGYFGNTGASGYALVGFDTYKIQGNGSVAFAQNHPTDAKSVIVYNSPEGDEVAVYTRGTARLVRGEARVALGETFRWVTNPDLGLTAHVTPVGAWSDLYVVSKSTTDLVVRSRGGAPDAAFDYVVYGLRIGFEEVGIVQEKEHESFIPSMKKHRERLARNPDLRAYTALARFSDMERSVNGRAAVETGQAAALKAAIHEDDPAIDPLPVVSRAAQAVADGVPTAAPADVVSPAACPPVTILSAEESIDAGELLVLDPLRPGRVLRSRSPADPLVIAIAAGSTTVDASGALAVPVADGHFALVRADASYGVIRAGDLLTASATAGHAMKASPSTPPSAIVGKSVDALEAGRAAIRVLLWAR